MINSGKTLEFLQLVKDNPDLPIVPFVDGEICPDYCGRWMGSFGGARIDEYLFPRYPDNPVLFKSDDDVFDVLEKHLTDAEFEALPADEETCRAVYDGLPWKKAIIVYIDLPDIE